MPHFETNLIKNEFQDYNFITTSSDMFLPPEEKMLKSGPTWHGTAIAWDKCIDKFISKIEVTSERFCGVKFSDYQTNILAYTAYLPTSGQDEAFLEVLEQFEFDIKNHITGKCIILIGLDSNQSDRSSKRRTSAMEKFKKEFSLKSILVNNQPTFHHNNQKSESQIDHILYFIPDNVTAKVELEKHLCKLENYQNLSSHDAIIGKLSIPLSCISDIEPDYSSSYTTFLAPKPKWNDSGMEGYQAQSAQMLENLSKQFKTNEDIPVLAELFSKVLVISAKNNFDTKVVKPRRKLSKNPFFSLEHREAYRNHEIACKSWRKEGRPQIKRAPCKNSKIRITA